MPTLVEILTGPNNKERVIADCCALVDAEVDSKRGLTGAAVKAAFHLVAKVKPGFVREVVGKLLPAFAASLEPMYVESVAAAGERPVSVVFPERLRAQPRRAAEALLEVTDARIDGARPAIKKAYERLRKGARDHVEAAVPGLAKAVGKYV